VTIVHHKKPQVSKYYFKKKTSSHSSRNGKDGANHDSRIQPGSPLSRQSLTFYDAPTYHAGEHGRGHMVQVLLHTQLTRYFSGHTHLTLL
jgi:hypothetical protein